MSITRCPIGSWIDMPAPSAAANGSRTISTRSAPADCASRTSASISTEVAPNGTQTTRTLRDKRRPCEAIRMKCRNIARAASKSAITPSRNGRTTWMNSGDRPIMVRARSPKAIASPVARWIATADGSERTTPLSSVYTRECAVPRSMAMRCQSIACSMAPAAAGSNSRRSSRGAVLR